MSDNTTDRNLLFGLIAMQSDLIDMRQFVDACTLWGSRKDSTLAEILVDQKWLLPEDRQHVDYLLQRRMQKVGGDVRKSLAAIPDDVKTALQSIDDRDIRSSLQATQDDRRITTSLAITPPDRSDDRITRRGLHSTGGIGHVWLAHDKLLDRDIALKELKHDQSKSAINRERFFREAQITAQLTHPGTVPVYDFVDNGDRSFYTMKFMKGRTLAEVIADFHQWRRQNEIAGVSSQLVQLLTQFVGICHTVAFAHSRRVIHRDLKSENVLVGDFGEVVVLDWGLAKRLDESEPVDETLPVNPDATIIDSERDPRHSSQTMQGDKLGTPAYMSPEQARGEIDIIDERTDIYGLAAILYEILVGDPPFLGKSIIEVLEHVIHDAPQLPGDCVAGIPVELEKICLKGLAKKRDDRQQSAEELAGEIQSWITDRAERKRTEQERERFFNLSLDLLTILDTAGHLTQTNPAWETVLGWPPDALQGKPVWELIDPADHERATKNHARILSGESLTQMEYRCLCRDGGYRWILWNAKLIPGQSSIYLVGRDITERKQAEQTFQNLLESAPDAMVVVNHSGTIVLVNAQLEKLFGYERDQLLGQPIETLVPQQFRADHPAKVAAYVAEPNARPMGAGLELIGERIDGSVFPVEISLSPVETEQGLLISCAVRNIEKRKKEQQKLQAILDSTPDAMVIVDKHRKIIMANTQVERLFAYEPDELLGEVIEILVPERFRAGHPSKFAAFAGKPEFRPMGTNAELFGQRKDGGEFPVEISLSSFTTDDESFFISTIRDMTGRKRSEQRFAALLESAPDAMVVVTPDRTIQIVNSQLEKLFGYHRDELLGQPIEILIPDRFRPGHPEKFATFLSSPQTRPMASGLDLRGQCKDGREIRVEVSLSPVNTEEGMLISAAIRKSRSDGRAQS
ncbi:Serine/threonine-protein kinase PknD [Symmachiella macrocystis]|uniref:Serine/threonine-protein kinase PknD n=1 Tax=Symmachiella macrocystis TaxID=2527985 RepID=A0A5C6AYW5_9PLAN|nr:PAS domain S-box protein [Symmachiella macrocystis]TWU05173.1 Serine/threonine-protein kinase PknD [Symmachiella macrocystis]